MAGRLFDGRKSRSKSRRRAGQDRTGSRGGRGGVPEYQPHRLCSCVGGTSQFHLSSSLFNAVEVKVAEEGGPVAWEMGSIPTRSDRYTAHDGGYRNGADYYDRAGAHHVLDAIAVPTLIITAQDDPFIPYSMFIVPKIQQHPHIRVMAPRYGGHCGFFHRGRNGEDPYWAENRIVDFLQGRL
jgi:pimeloyl-ACP methyl ester carboxylesterase